MSDEIFSRVLEKPANLKKLQTTKFRIIMVTPTYRYRFLKRGIRPEILPLEKDLTKPGRRVKSRERKITGRKNFSLADGQ
jgi:hypothetical protein